MSHTTTITKQPNVVLQSRKGNEDDNIKIPLKDFKLYEASTEADLEDLRAKLIKMRNDKDVADDFIKELHQEKSKLKSELQIKDKELEALKSNNDVKSIDTSRKHYNLEEAYSRYREKHYQETLDQYRKKYA